MKFGGGGVGMKKKFKVLIVILVVLILGYGVYRLADFVISIGYDSESRLREDISEAEEEQKKVDVNDTIEYKNPDSESGYSEVEVLYSNVDLEDRREEFLDREDNFDKYIDIIAYVEDNAEDVFNTLEVGEESLAEEAKRVLDASFEVSYDWNELSGYSSVYVRNGATVIDMFCGKYVIYSYNYYFNDKVQLFVVDYSKSLFNVNYKKLIDFGQENTLLFYPDLCYKETVDGIDIVYFKEI